MVLLVLQVEAAVVYYDWKVEYLSVAPDCVDRLVLAINGQFPSPTINAVEGDTVVVKLTNMLPTEGVVLHWHGIKQVCISTMKLMLEKTGPENPKIVADRLWSLMPALTSYFVQTMRISHPKTT